MKGQILKKYQQKELNLMHVTCKKTRNYIFLCRVRSGEKIEKAKARYFFYIRGQNETEYNRIYIPLL